LAPQTQLLLDNTPLVPSVGVEDVSLIHMTVAGVARLRVRGAAVMGRSSTEKSQPREARV
jgi:hypothetical protein